MVFYRNLRIFALPILGIMVITTVLFSCGGDTKDDQIENKISNSIDSNASTLVKFDNTLFSMPSPYEIAFLVKRANLEYNKGMLNPYNKSHNYVTNFDKALNMGIYGSDLGYLTLYEQNSDAIQYFSVVKILSQELNIENAFDKKTVTRIESNIGNKDSLMYIVSTSYRKADQYLKDNNRNDVGVLILAGGWIESTYMLTQLAKQSNKPEILTRIAEQKHPLDNLIKLLSPYYNTSKEYAEMTDQLIDLAYDFDGIDISYTYAPPKVDEQNKLTIINSKSQVNFSDQQLKTITEKLEKIRNNIVK
ncbi:MAG TPA: hypothetical protein PLP65_09790 [Bacteroidales bacterium]|jgi:hypothetical protein|nr:hypothetical protein [Bacteroidales bacterium]HOU99123.1 hypothetical protein [Bacteroidales bacterium]